jgi:hypothetical protein
MAGFVLLMLPVRPPAGESLVAWAAVRPGLGLVPAIAAMMAVMLSFALIDRKARPVEG